MNYKQYINRQGMIVGDNFKEAIADPNENLSLFYMNLGDPPVELSENITEIPPFISQDPTKVKSLDKVEHVYSKSFTFGWFPVTTTITEKGFELYIDNEHLPIDFFAKEHLNKYNRWFLGYKNNLNDVIKPCIYGSDTRVLIQSRSNNTLQLNMSVYCDIKLCNTDTNSYIDYLEKYKNEDKKKYEFEFYRQQEFDRKYLNEESLDTSIGTTSVKRGKIYLSNE